MASKDKLLASAQKNIQKGHVAKAVKDYQKLVEMDAGDVRHRQKLAELLSRADQTDQALEEYQKVAKHYADRGFYLKAIAVYKQMQKLEPENPDFYHRLAELNRKQGLVGNALAEYRSLVAFHEKHHRTGDAIQVLETMREIDPENYNIRVKVAESYAKHGLEEKALGELQELEGIFRQKNDLDRLARLQELFVPLFPGRTEIPLGLADTLIRKGEGGRAVELLKEQLVASPEDAEVLSRLAEAYQAVGDHENERLTLKHLLKNLPEDPALRRRYLEASLDGGRPEKALGEFDNWREDFAAAGELDRLEGVGRRLAEAYPERADLQEMFAAGTPPGAGTAAPETEETPAEEPVEAAPPGEAPEEPPPGAEDVPEEGGGGAAVEEAGPPAGPVAFEEAEVPLDFLEEAGLQAAAGEKPAGEAPLSGEAVQEPPVEESPEPEAEGAPEAAGEPPEEDARLPAEGSEAPSADGMLELEIDLEIEGPDLEEPAPGDGEELSGEETERETLPAQEAVPETDDEPGGQEPTPAPHAWEQPVEEELSLPDVRDEEPAETGPAAGEWDPKEEDSAESVAEEPAEEELAGETRIEEGAAGAATLPAGEADSGEAGWEDPVAVEEEPFPGGVAAEEAEAGSETGPEELEVVEETVASGEDLPSAGEEELLVLEEEAPEEDEEPVDLELVEMAEPEAEAFDLELSEELDEEIAPAGAEEAELASELEEVEFFLQQGLYADAERLCRELEERFPDSAEVGSKLEAAAAGLQEQAAGKEQEEFFDFGTEVLEEVEEQVGDFLEQAETEAVEEDDFSLDGIFSDSQRGVETDIEAEDTESHYNLGIAYKEMGLLDDAVAEFDQAMRSPERRGDSLTLKGICLAEQGRVEEAEEAFRTALAEPSLPEEQQTSLFYELGLLYRQAGNLEAALEAFQEVAARDHFYREVGERLQELREALGLEAEKTDETSGKDKRDRISYV